MEITASVAIRVYPTHTSARHVWPIFSLCLPQYYKCKKETTVGRKSGILEER